MGDMTTTLLAAQEVTPTPSLFEVFGEHLAAAQIQLADGTMFAPFAPHPEAFTLENISTGLSNSCRFGGQAPRFYSVAQHSVLVAALCEKNIVVQKFALLHDAEEGFGLPDLPTPLKPFLSDIVDAQHDMSQMIFDRYDLSPRLKAKVKPSDTIALSMEKRDLKKASPAYLADLPRPPGNLFIEPLQPDDARVLFDDACTRVFGQGLPVTVDWLLKQRGFSAAPTARAA